MCTLFQAKPIKAQSNCVDFPSVLCEPLLVLCVAMSDAIGCPLELLYFLYSQFLLLAWDSMLMLPSMRCGKNQPYFGSLLPQRTKESCSSSTIEGNPLKRLGVWNQKIDDISKNILQQHQLTTHLSCALTTSALRSYIM